MGRYVLSERMLVQISLSTLFILFIVLTLVQYLVGVFVSAKLNFNQHKLISVFQVFITLFCVWVSASSDKTTMQLGTGMLIFSYLIYVPYSFKKSGRT